MQAYASKNGSQIAAVATIAYAAPINLLKSGRLSGTKFEPDWSWYFPSSTRGGNVVCDVSIGAGYMYLGTYCNARGDGGTLRCLAR